MNSIIVISVNDNFFLFFYKKFLRVIAYKIIISIYISLIKQILIVEIVK